MKDDVLPRSSEVLVTVSSIRDWLCRVSLPGILCWLPAQESKQLRISQFCFSPWQVCPLVLQMRSCLEPSSALITAVCLGSQQRVPCCRFAFGALKEICSLVYFARKWCLRQECQLLFYLKHTFTLNFPLAEQSQHQWPVLCRVSWGNKDLQYSSLQGDTCLLHPLWKTYSGLCLAECFLSC